MSFSVSASPRVSEEGTWVTISGEATGGDSDATCIKVGYKPDGETSAGKSGSFKPKPGSYTSFAVFTLAKGNEDTEDGDKFEVSVKPPWYP